MRNGNWKAKIIDKNLVPDSINVGSCHYVFTYTK